MRLLLNTIDTMEKDNEKLRVRNHQLKATGKSQVASLIGCEEAVITYGGRQEC